MSESKLDRLLQELKGTPVLDPQFRNRVLGSLEEVPNAKAWPLWYGSVAATLFLFLGAFGWVHLGERQASESLRKAEIKAVRQEIDSIRAELEKSSTPEPEVVLWVASTKNVDLFVDAKPWANSIGIQPASLIRKD